MKVFKWIMAFLIIMIVVALFPSPLPADRAISEQSVKSQTSTGAEKPFEQLAMGSQMATTGETGEVMYATSLAKPMKKLYAAVNSRKSIRILKL